jgi:hypothetical protein
MYKEGVIFPTNLFFINDELRISSIIDIKNQIFTANETTKIPSNIDSEKIILEYLIEKINKNKGYENISLLLNYFPNIIFRKNIAGEKLIANSVYNFDNSEFNRCIINNTINLEDLDDALEQLKYVAEFDKSVVISEIYNFLYKCYFYKICNHVSFSDSPNNQVTINFTKDTELYFKTKEELGKYKPHQINNYDGKKNFCDRFRNSFYVKSEVEFLKLLDNLISHTISEAMKTFGKLITRNINFHSNQTANSKNKTFRPLFKIINSYVFDKKYDNTPISIKNLTKENKRFMSTLK